ncbi:hypothetical protein ABLN67_22075 [Mycobacterium tuberculosis]
MFNRFIYRRGGVFAFIVKRFRVFVRRFNDEAILPHPPCPPGPSQGNGAGP